MAEMRRLRLGDVFNRAKITAGALQSDCADLVSHRAVIAIGGVNRAAVSQKREISWRAISQSAVCGVIALLYVYSRLCSIFHNSKGRQRPPIDDDEQDDKEQNTAGYVSPRLMPSHVFCSCEQFSVFTVMRLHFALSFILSALTRFCCAESNLT